MGVVCPRFAEPGQTICALTALPNHEDKGCSWWGWRKGNDQPKDAVANNNGGHHAPVNGGNKNRHSHASEESHGACCSFMQKASQTAKPLRFLFPQHALPGRRFPVPRRKKKMEPEGNGRNKLISPRRPPAASLRVQRQRQPMANPEICLTS